MSSAPARASSCAHTPPPNGTIMLDDQQCPALERKKRAATRHQIKRTILSDNLLMYQHIYRKTSYVDTCSIFKRTCSACAQVPTQQRNTHTRGLVQMAPDTRQPEPVLANSARFLRLKPFLSRKLDRQLFHQRWFRFKSSSLGIPGT